MTDITPLSGDELNKLVDDFEASEHNRMAMNAVTAAGIDKVARNYDRARLMQRRFSTVVDNGTVTHQDRSGRCWLFSSLNVARFVAKQNMGLKEFEFSQNYAMYYDKLERVNYFLKDVAKLAGVSTAAASKALRGEKDIGPETRARVEKIAESLGYCTNNLAIYLRNGSIKALGVVMPDSFNPYNALVLQGVEEKAKELGYNVIIGNTNCDRALERDLLKSFVSMKVSGILAIPSWLENYKTIPVPLIIMSRFPYMEPYASKAHAILRPDVQYIVNDDFSGQYLAVEHLIQRGFRNNYLIIGSTEPDSAEGVMNLMRKDGYRKALADAGIAFAEDHVIENVRSIHESYRVVTQLLKSGAGRIGLCMNMDHLALAAHDCGARIPEDIGLVGYDDIDSAKYMTPALTTISQSKYAIGAQSAIQVINARDGTEPWRKVLKPTLVVRRST